MSDKKLLVLGAAMGGAAAVILVIFGLLILRGRPEVAAATIPATTPVIQAVAVKAPAPEPAPVSAAVVPGPVAVAQAAAKSAPNPAAKYIKLTDAFCFQATHLIRAENGWTEGVDFLARIGVAMI